MGAAGIEKHFKFTSAKAPLATNTIAELALVLPTFDVSEQVNVTVSVLAAVQAVTPAPEQSATPHSPVFIESTTHNK